MCDAATFDREQTGGLFAWKVQRFVAFQALSEYSRTVLGNAVQSEA